MDAPSSGVFAAHSSYLDRWIQIGIASGNVISVSFPASDPGAETHVQQPVLDRLLAYLDAGERDDFSDVEVGLTVPTEHRRIYEAVRAIPYGTSWPLERVAIRTAIVEPGEEGMRAVRRALGANPIPLLVPDHRVDGVEGGISSDIRQALRSRENLE